MRDELKIDWFACPEIEVIAGKMNGQPVIKGTRVRPETIVANFEGGSQIEEIQENYPHIPLETIRRIIDFYQACHPQLTL